MKVWFGLEIYKFKFLFSRLYKCPPIDISITYPAAPHFHSKTMASLRSTVRTLVKPDPILKQLRKNRENGKYKPQFQNKNAIPKKFHIMRGDKVEVIQRNHPAFGMQGTVLEMIRSKNRLVVEGVNMYNSLVRGDPAMGIGNEYKQKERSIHYSNVNLVCPQTNLPTKISRKFLEDGTKVRISKRSGAIIPRPEILSVRKNPKRTELSFKDTEADDVWAISYVNNDNL